MAAGMLRHRFRCAEHHDLVALIAAIMSRLNHPVGTADHLEVVLEPLLPFRSAMYDIKACSALGMRSETPFSLYSLESGLRFKRSR